VTTPTTRAAATRARTQLAAAIAVAAAALGCTGSPAVRTAERASPRAACTFVNPVGPGADPWVVREKGAYFYVQSRQGGIWVSKAATLRGAIGAPAVRVWTPPDTGWNRTNIWAPELHFIDGRPYIYYAGGRAGPPFLSQHAGVLEGATDDAQGAYLDRGMLYTGDSIATGRANRWSIDLTVGQIGRARYAVWSGWKDDALTDRTPQLLYIAPMSNPWTISANRVLLSAPVESWERGTELDLQEGPELLRHGRDLFVLYSTRESWLRDYRLGELRLRDTAANPLDPTSWTKTGPVFAGTATVYGVGHASFTVSPDGTEDWIVYHAKVSTAPGWDRVVRLQRFRWSADGAPAFGIPVASGEPLPVPSGECR
jgi:GH43 family beta-xylosidase